VPGEEIDDSTIDWISGGTEQHMLLPRPPSSLRKQSRVARRRGGHVGPASSTVSASPSPPADVLCLSDSVSLPCGAGVPPPRLAPRPRPHARLPPSPRARLAHSSPAHADAFEGDVILHLLSLPKAIYLAVCLLCWRGFATCTVADARQKCFCIVLLDSVLQLLHNITCIQCSIFLGLHCKHISSSVVNRLQVPFKVS
jgi:hypothetical protein